MFERSVWRMQQEPSSPCPIWTAVVIPQEKKLENAVYSLTLHSSLHPFPPPLPVISFFLIIRESGYSARLVLWVIDYP